jgi:hypothetical protein
MSARANERQALLSSPPSTQLAGLHPLGIPLTKRPGCATGLCWTWESGSTDRTTSVAVCGDVLARLATSRCLLTQATRARTHTELLRDLNIQIRVLLPRDCGGYGNESMSQYPGRGVLQRHKTIHFGQLKQCLQYHKVRRHRYRQKTKHETVGGSPN